MIYFSQRQLDVTTYLRDVWIFAQFIEKRRLWQTGLCCKGIDNKV